MMRGVSETERLRRWRLVLGGGDGRRHRTPTLDGDDVRIDAALGAVYDESGSPAGRPARPAGEPRSTRSVGARPFDAAGRTLARRHPPVLPVAGGAGAAARCDRASRPAPPAARTRDARGGRTRPPPRHVARRAQPPAARRDAGDGAHRRRQGARPTSSNGSPTAPAKPSTARSPAPTARAGRGRATSTGHARSTPTCATGCPNTAPSYPSG